MLEPLFTVLLIGITAGFVFSMPIAGPISILITSNALKGKKRFCIRTALGAAIVEALYVLIAVYGMALLFSAYSSIVPYLLIVGALFLLFVAYKIFISKLELENIEGTGENINKNLEENKGGFRIGLLLNLTNPSLFFGILTSSFIVLSFASSIGLNTGGLEILVEENVSSIQEITGETFEKLDSAFEKTPSKNAPDEKSSYTLLLSLLYAVSLAAGGFIWFYILTFLLIKFRTKIKLIYLNWIIKGLSLILFGISIYLLWTAIRMISS